jgi:hypothetical protein
MSARWRSDVASAPHKRIAVSPRVRPPAAPPIDLRRLRAAIRLMFGAASCAVHGHDWECQVIIRSNWTGRDYTKIEYRDRRRHCRRCEQHQTRELHGSWHNAN